MVRDPRRLLLGQGWLTLVLLCLLLGLFQRVFPCELSFGRILFHATYIVPIELVRVTFLDLNLTNVVI